MPLYFAESKNYKEVIAILRKAGAQLNTDGQKSSLAPAKEQEIRKVARDFALQIRMIEPDFTKEQIALVIEDKMIIQPDPHASDADYLRFKEEMRAIIRDAI